MENSLTSGIEMINKVLKHWGNNLFSDNLIQYLILNSNVWFSIFDEKGLWIDEKINGRVCSDHDFWICRRLYSGR